MRPMNRLTLILAVTIPIVVASRSPTGAIRSQERTIGPLDKSGAFFAPAFATRPDDSLADAKDGPITAGTYMRYLSARFGTRYLEDLAFDELLARECRARGIGRSALLLARGLGARRFHGAGRESSRDARADVRRKLVNDELRRLRIDALVREDRTKDEVRLRALFDRRYGVDGKKVRIRQILVSLKATRSRKGSGATEAMVRAAAHDRARDLSTRLAEGAKFTALLRESDDRTTRRLLRDPKQAAQAGFVEGYNYHRYGEAFAAAVHALEPGQISKPVSTATGFHLIELVDRKITRYEDVKDAVRAEVRGAPASKSEAQALRRALFEKYQLKIKNS